MKGNKIINIEEKPVLPKSNYVVTGYYLYNPDVFDVIEKLEYSKRGELEISDANNYYVKNNTLTFGKLSSIWTDAGTFSSYHYANRVLYKENKND